MNCKAACHLLTREEEVEATDHTMRLINTDTLELMEFFDAQIPEYKYAILSHRWSQDELSFEEYTSESKHNQPEFEAKAGYRKVVDLCRLAREGIVHCGRGAVRYQWAWIDTVCIDKRSSAELSEAINSMYKWYQMSGVCVVFLPDVMAVDTQPGKTRGDLISIPGHSTFKRDDFLQSCWFTRGWTLQELTAPTSVLFYDTSLRTLGPITKVGQFDKDKVSFDALHNVTAEAAHIDRVILQSTEPRSGAGSIAYIMSWAAHRQTTRAEDMAYCLLGLCGVNMPLLYGEGGDRAFRRLQLEIISSNPDISIFAFHQTWNQGILANHPSQFSGCEGPDVLCQRPRILNKTSRGLEFEVHIPKGLRHRYPNRPMLLLLTLSNERTSSKLVHVVFQTIPSYFSNEYRDGYVEAHRVGCFSSDSHGGSSETALWQQLLGWRQIDGPLFELLSQAHAGVVPYARHQSIRDRVRELMYKLYPSRLIKVWVPLDEAFPIAGWMMQ